MKIYEVGGRKVWLDKAPEGYEVLQLKELLGMKVNFLSD